MHGLSRECLPFQRLCTLIIGHPTPRIHMRRGGFLPENDRKPDNVLSMELGGTKYTILEYFEGRNTINNIVAKRVASDAKAAGNNSGNLLPPVTG